MEEDGDGDEDVRAEERRNESRSDAFEKRARREGSVNALVEDLGNRSWNRSHDHRDEAWKERGRGSV